MQYCGAGKFGRKHHGAFNVYMSVYKTGADIFARDIMNTVCIRFGIIADSDNSFIFNKYVCFFKLIGENIDHRSAFKQSFQKNSPFVLYNIIIYLYILYVKSFFQYFLPQPHA